MRANATPEVSVSQLLPPQNCLLLFGFQHQESKARTPASDREAGGRGGRPFFQGTVFSFLLTQNKEHTRELTLSTLCHL